MKICYDVDTVIASCLRIPDKKIHPSGEYTAEELIDIIGYPSDSYFVGRFENEDDARRYISAHVSSYVRINSERNQELWCTVYGLHRVEIDDDGCETFEVVDVFAKGAQ